MKTLSLLSLFIATTIHAASFTVTPTNGVIPFNAVITLSPSDSGNGYQTFVDGNFAGTSGGPITAPFTNAGIHVVAVEMDLGFGPTWTNLTPVTVLALTTNSMPVSVTLTNPPYCPTNAPVTITNTLVVIVTNCPTCYTETASTNGGATFFPVIVPTNGITYQIKGGMPH